LTVSSSNYSSHCISLSCFFLNTPSTVIYTLSLHDALPIYYLCRAKCIRYINNRIFRPLNNIYLFTLKFIDDCLNSLTFLAYTRRSEEHTSELQSRFELVCRLLLEKKNNKIQQQILKQYNRF